MMQRELKPMMASRRNSAPASAARVRSADRMQSFEKRAGNIDAPAPRLSVREKSVEATSLNDLRLYRLDIAREARRHKSYPVLALERAGYPPASE